MNIAIVGAGFTGLTAAIKLLNQNHSVTIFEKEDLPGGLALGFKEKAWEWSLEKHYHHWFTNDNYALSLANKIKHRVIIKRPKTSVFVDNKIYQLDSPFSVMRFPKLNICQRLRMAIALGLLKYNPYWQQLEKYQASDILPKAMGKRPYEILWKPLLKSKFGKHMDTVSLAWFWARIRKRTPSLAYPEGGFLEFANALVKKIEDHGGNILFDTQISEIKKAKDCIRLTCLNDSNHFIKTFDKVIVTLPSFIFLKITPDLPDSYKKKLSQLKGLGAINLILRLKKPFLNDGTYWLNVCDEKSPIMAIVEHTNFMDKKYYNNEHIVYLGNYVAHDHPYMKMTANELLKIYTPYLKKINPIFQLSTFNFHLFKVPFAQPIIPINYSKIIPPFETPLKNIYLANIQQVYPWDRGTNYAIELGEKVAGLVNEN